MTYLNHFEEQIQFKCLSKTSPFWVSYSQEVHMLNTEIKTLLQRYNNEGCYTGENQPLLLWLID